MTTQELEKLKFPIGKYQFPGIVSEETKSKWISIIEEFPENVENLIGSLLDDQLDTPYRPGGWTIRQLAHHVGDSHMNALLRFKWTLTEDKPTIKAYDQSLFAELSDSTNAPVALALQFLKGLHAKWVFLLKSMSEKDFNRSFIHPETKAEVVLTKLLGMYAWHCEHHLAHFKNIIKEKGWK